MALPEVGDLFQSRYRLDDILGAGGFATVFLATDVAADRSVAVKVLRPQIGGYDDAVRLRFEREVQIVANLRDAHTITMFDFGTTPAGLLFMVTEYVPGRDLTDLIKERGRLAPHETIHIMCQMLSALREAHAAGLLHRDIKPANIRIFSYMGDDLHAKLLDFGIANSVEGQSDGVTGAGEVVGTLRYMSPEQLLSSERLSPASDLYSLGVVAFEMLLGGAGIHGSELYHQMDRLNTGHLFSVPELERMGPVLSRVLDRMTARRPEDRFRTADEVLAALSVASSQPQPAAMAHALPPTVTAQRAVAPAPAQTSRMIMLGIGLASLAIATVVLLALRSAPDEPPPQAPTQRRDLAILRTNEPAKPIDVGVQIRDVSPDLVADDDVAVLPRDDHGSIGCGATPGFRGFGSIAKSGALVRNELPTYLPGDYSSDRAFPLIVMLHENAEGPINFMKYSRFPQLADNHGFVIVAPEGGQPYAWDYGRLADTVVPAIKLARRELCIDTQRIYIVAHSAGGKMAERAPCEIPDVAAIATTSFRGEPSQMSSLCKPKNPIPYLHIAPQSDGYNPVEGGQGCGSFKISLKEKEDAWRSNNHCANKRSTWLKRGNSVCYQWECDAPFISCHLDGGRGWNGTSRRMFDLNNCDGTPADFPYADTIWNFFQEFGAQ